MENSNFSVHQFEVMRRGFNQVLLPGAIELLLTDELKRLICCDQFKRWTVDELRKYCVNEDSKSVQFLFQCLASFDVEKQKMFLKFAIGMIGLAHGRLRCLNPRLTISVINRDHPDCILPNAATCFNHLYLPDYSSLNITRQKLLYAIHEGNESFRFV